MNQTPDHLLGPHKAAVIAAVRELLHASMAEGAVFEIPGTSPAHVVAIGPRAAIPRMLELRVREPMAGGRRLSDALPAEPLNWNEPEPGQPRRWAALITSANHGMLAEPGHSFPAVQARFERIEVVEVLPGAPVDALSDDDLWHIAGVVRGLAGGSFYHVSQYDCVTAIRASFMDPDTAREYTKARVIALDAAPEGKED